MTTIALLENELLERIQTVPQFGDRGFSIFNLDEVGDIAAAGVGFPLAAVAYIGTVPRENSVNTTSGVQSAAADIIMVQKQFAVLVAVEYNWSDTENTKVVATDLLDQVRGKLLGFKGVNKRPWTLLDEGPAESNIDAAILYMQTWATLTHDKGDSAEQ